MTQRPNLKKNLIRGLGICLLTASGYFNFHQGVQNYFHRQAINAQEELISSYKESTISLSDSVQDSYIARIQREKLDSLVGIKLDLKTDLDFDDVTPNKFSTDTILVGNSADTDEGVMLEMGLAREFFQER
ncbi:hypothetical protein HOD75_02170 [archaeon]|jgi:hypothetical protein|nr:hypothetical protein [archaeon]MBT4241683.1 hypothetical protein [archaeon]MBT4418078.1 hypothetical protein [archaeon]